MSVPTPHWRLAAACQSSDPDLFFPLSSSGPSLDQIAQAKEICAGCAVRAECLAFAMRTHQVHGVWGGMSEEERRSARGRDERRMDQSPGDGGPLRVLARDTSAV
jgi:WhiB family redox-sensing transcriptional regulator